MAKYATRYRRKNGYKRRRYGRRKPSAMAFARKKVKMPRMLRRFAKGLNAFAEKKIVTFDGSGGTNIQSSGLVVGSYAISQGTGRTQRVGNKVFIRYVKLKGFIYENASATGMVRVAAVWPRNTALTVGDLPFSYSQPIDPDRWTVIFDKLIPMQVVSTANPINYGSNSYIPIDYTLKVFKTMMYDDTSTTTQDTGPVFYFYSSDSLAPSPYISYHLSVTFTDV